MTNNDYVDLGLPSGTLWAKCNLGATKPEEYGKYYQWGDIVGYDFGEVRMHSSWATTPFNGGKPEYDASEFKKIKDIVCPNGVLAKEYDAVYQATNGIAHMPTKEQLEELRQHTTNEWVSLNGVNGKKFTSKTNGNSIFIPAAGYAYNGSFHSVGSFGFVWSSSLYSRYHDYAYYMYFFSVNVNPDYGMSRFCGVSLRGVISDN